MRIPAYAVLAVAGILWHEPWGPGVVSAAADNIRELIAAAQGTPPEVCGLAAKAVENGWDNASDAPVTPLAAHRLPRRSRGHRRYDMTADDVRFLLESLSTRDACVRELAIRLLGTQGGDEVGPGLLQRLGSPDSTIAERRRVRAGPRRVGPGGGRAGAGAGRSVHRRHGQRRLGARPDRGWPRRGAGDARAEATIRRSCARPRPRRSATSTRRAPSPPCSGCSRAIQSPTVRRAAAWALGQLEAAEAADGLAAALRSDKDAEVREMCAWALGEMDTKRGADALLAAARSDRDNSVRETAAWALGEHGDASAAGALGELLAAEKNPGVRGTAAWALGQMDLETGAEGADRRGRRSPRRTCGPAPRGRCRRSATARRSRRSGPRSRRRPTPRPGRPRCGR